LRRNTVGVSGAKLGNDGRGRYSGGLFAGPAPTATIPNLCNSPHAALVMRMVPVMMFLSVICQ